MELIKFELPKCALKTSFQIFVLEYIYRNGRCLILDITTMHMHICHTKKVSQIDFHVGQRG